MLLHSNRFHSKAGVRTYTPTINKGKSFKQNTLFYLSLHLFNLSLGDTLQNTVHFRHLFFRDDNRGPIGKKPTENKW